ncbi:MAG: GT4 family glycosyltransferase PelF [Candidatus Wallbacteria bacterium]
MVDICIICEGTYPYITGGVSAWVHDIIRNFPNLTFGVVHIASKKDPFRELKYKLPPNVIEFQEVFIHEPMITSDGSPGIADSAFEFQSFHNEISKGRLKGFENIAKRVAPELWPDKSPHSAVTIEQMLYSRQSFEIVKNLYKQNDLKTSFIDYYWTFRTTHLPLMQVLNADILKAAVYHPVSTGYAGLYSVLAKMKTGSPIVLTEHGIYTVERKIEISEADWILDDEREMLKIQAQLGKIKDFWVKIFDFLSKITYHHADEIISLYTENKKMQVNLGADGNLIKLIPNGIDLEKFENLKGRLGGDNGVFKVGFVGRVVPVKDVETFVRSCKIINGALKNVEFYVIGPEDEDIDYSKNIRKLVTDLGLNGKLKFTGLANSADYYKILDVLVLTSITEVQPLVMLEAMAAGIPVVSSNVGACREMVHGDAFADQKLGACGIITKIKSPDETAEAVIKILNAPGLWREMAISGQKRVQAYYQKKRLISSYREIYFNNLAQSRSK